MYSHWPLSLCLVVALTVHADSETDKAKAALALVKAQRERQATTTAAKPKPRAIVVEDCYEDLATAKTVAATINKPLVLWVGMTCRDAPDVCQSICGEAVSCHVKSYKGDATPRIVVPEPSGKEYRILKSELNKDSAIGIRLRMDLPVKGYVAESEAKAQPAQPPSLPVSYVPLHLPPALASTPVSST